MDGRVPPIAYGNMACMADISNKLQKAVSGLEGSITDLEQALQDAEEAAKAETLQAIREAIEDVRRAIACAERAKNEGQPRQQVTRVKTPNAEQD